jgi:hypothetical protein
MNLKLENKADYERVITELHNEMQELKKEIEIIKNSKGGFFKPDIISKMPKHIADALAKARNDFLPLQKSMTSKKDGKTFAILDDYIEATSNAFTKNGISISFEEIIEPSPVLVATISLKGSNEKHVMPTEVKPANMQDPKLAIKYGFQNAKVSIYKTLSLLK